MAQKHTQTEVATYKLNRPRGDLVREKKTNIEEEGKILYLERQN